MRLIKFAHACVRLESDGGVLVIDPGVFTYLEMNVARSAACGSALASTAPSGAFPPASSVEAE